MSSTARDERWFPILTSIADFNDITYLRYDQTELSAARERFLRDARRVPEFRFDSIPVAALTEKRALIEDLRAQISQAETDDEVRALYESKLLEFTKKIDLLLAAAAGDDAAFFAQSCAIYGVPEEQPLRRGVATLVQVCAAYDIPVPETIHRLQETLAIKQEETLSDYLISSPHGPQLNANEIQQRFVEKLHELGIAWGVTLSPAVSYITVDYPNHQILIPTDRHEYASVVAGLLKHEIETHVLRYYNAQQGDLLLHSLGVAGYLQTEEGLAAYQEQQVSRVYLPGFAYYVGAAVLTGVGALETGDFASVFATVRAVSEVQHRCTGRPALEQIDSEAWKRTMRLFRGIRDVNAGYCFTRDTVYWPGFLAVRSYVANGGDLAPLLRGKVTLPTRDQNSRIC